MNNHSDRGHAVWSMSANAANMHCPGRISMLTLVSEEDRQREAAAWGTACHQIGERCLRDGGDADQYMQKIEISGKFEFVVDDEMTDTAQTYIDYVRKKADGGGTSLWIEEYMSLAKIDPPFEAGGTADAIITTAHRWLNEEWADVELVDLKAGRGVKVDVKGSAQLRGYALGVVLHFPDVKIRNITITIVQPRMPHEDGRIRSETFHVAELVEWTAELLEAMQHAKQAQDHFLGNSINFPAWAEKWLKPGVCTFCPAQSICPEFRKAALRTAGEAAAAWFEQPDSAPLVIAPAAADMTPAQMEHVLDGLDALEEWISAVRGRAHRMAEKSEKFERYVLVDKIGNRAFKEKDPAKLVAQFGARGLMPDEIFEEPSIRSVAQMEKKLKTKRAPLIADLWERPVKGTNLVARDKTTRSLPALSKAEANFEQPSETEKQ